MSVPEAVDYRELPSARRVLGRAFDLDLRASRELRNASLLLATQFLFLVGPIVLVFGVLLIRVPEYLDLFDPVALEDPQFVADLPVPDDVFVLRIGLGTLVALVGWAAIAIESQIIAIAVLAGRLTDRPLSLRESVARSRQTFWRVVRAGLIVAVPAGIAGGAVGTLLGTTSDPQSEASYLVSLAVGVVVATPFAYVPTAIVLGDVGAREAVLRGFRLVRARWRVAVVIALFSTAAQYLQIFALGAGGDILFRAGTVLDLGFDHGEVASALTIVVILAGTLAFGTLLFTTIAIAVAPQVVAFIALTHVHSGLDRAREAVAPPIVEPPVDPAVGPPATGEDEPGSGPPAGTMFEPAVAPAPEPAGTTPEPPAAPSPPASYWDEVPTQAGSVRLVSIPMIGGAIISIVLAVAAIDGISRIG